jgi:hypothetical protein
MQRPICDGRRHRRWHPSQPEPKRAYYARHRALRFARRLLAS